MYRTGGEVNSLRLDLAPILVHPKRSSAASRVGGPCSPTGRRCPLPQGPVEPLDVVRNRSGLDGLPGLFQRREPVLIEALSAEMPDDRLCASMVHGLGGTGRLDLHPMATGPTAVASRTKAAPWSPTT